MYLAVILWVSLIQPSSVSTDFPLLTVWMFTLLKEQLNQFNIWHMCVQYLYVALANGVDRKSEALKNSRDRYALAYGFLLNLLFLGATSAL